MVGGPPPHGLIVARVPAHTHGGVSSSSRSHGGEAACAAAGDAIGILPLPPNALIASSSGVDGRASAVAAKLPPFFASLLSAEERAALDGGRPLSDASGGFTVNRLYAGAPPAQTPLLAQPATPAGAGGDAAGTNDPGADGTSAVAEAATVALGPLAEVKAAMSAVDRAFTGWLRGWRDLWPPSDDAAPLDAPLPLRPRLALVGDAAASPPPPGQGVNHAFEAAAALVACVAAATHAKPPATATNNNAAHAAVDTAAATSATAAAAAAAAAASAAQRSAAVAAALVAYDARQGPDDAAYAFLGRHKSVLERASCAVAALVGLHPAPGPGAKNDARRYSELTSMHRVL
jgi:hypothetical protein